jgi:nucleoside-diphosphate-sugar epimerase
VRGTERLLEHLKEFQVEQFVFASTMLVHAPTEPEQRINEASPIDPRWPYPLSKVETEALIRKKRGKIPAVLLRLAGVYDDRCHSAFLSQQIARSYERQLLSRFYPGDIRRGQASVHLDDVTDALAGLIERRKDLPAELPLLVGEPETLSYDEVQRIASRRLHGEEWPTREIPKSLAKTGAWIENEVLDQVPFIKPWMVDFADDHYVLDISRARTLLGWEPKRSLRSTLPVMLDALKSDPVGWYQSNKLNAALVAGETATRPPAGIIEAPPSAPASSHHDNKLDAALVAQITAAWRPAEMAEANKRTDQMLAERRMLREHDEMMLGEHCQTLWPHFANIALGAWLLTSPGVLGLFEPSTFSEAILRVRGASFRVQPLDQSGSRASAVQRSLGERSTDHGFSEPDCVAGQRAQAGRRGCHRCGALRVGLREPRRTTGRAEIYPDLAVSPPDPADRR